MKHLIPIVVALGILAVAAACGGDDEATTPTHAAATASPKATVIVTASPNPATSIATQTAGQTPPANVCLPNPDPATPNFLQINGPAPGDTVSSPFTVNGLIAAFEATFRITLYDASGVAIADQNGMSTEGQTLSPFVESVSYTVASPQPACLWVYESSARDGSPIHVGQVPLALQP